MEWIPHGEQLLFTHCFINHCFISSVCHGDFQCLLTGTYFLIKKIQFTWGKEHLGKIRSDCLAQFNRKGLTTKAATLGTIEQIIVLFWQIGSNLPIHDESWFSCIGTTFTEINFKSLSLTVKNCKQHLNRKQRSISVRYSSFVQEHFSLNRMGSTVGVECTKLHKWSFHIYLICEKQNMTYCGYY